jgi:AcrR family transcriptional regulator
MLENTNSGRTPAPKLDRRSARREATKAEILDAAWELAREQGLLALSLRDLAAKVGMRAPSLYQYFDSKHAIYDAMFGQAAQQALESRNAEGDPERVRDSLRAGAHEFFEFAVADPVRAQLLFQRTIPGFEPSAASYTPAVAMVERLQQTFTTLGITDADAVDTWTSLLSGLVNQQLANDPGGARYQRLIDRAVDMYCNEFAPEPKPKPKTKKQR